MDHKSLYAWVGGWVVFDRPSKEKRLFFFFAPGGDMVLI